MQRVDERKKWDQVQAERRENYLHDRSQLFPCAVSVVRELVISGLVSAVQIHKCGSVSVMRAKF